ncbi:MAG: glycosyltransferase family 4 protein [Actinobacteria bacterium]|nr:glycosyltransferase family 4 protein [Actinomycetota bacterium]
MAATGVAVSLSKIGHQVKIIVCGQSLRDEQINSNFYEKLSHSGAEVRILQRRRESKYGTVLRLTELRSLWIDASKSDFVILHQVFELQYLSVFPVLLLLKKPYAVMPHGTLTTYQRKQHKFRKLLFYPGTYIFLKLSKGIFVATKTEKDQLPEYLNAKGIEVGLGIELTHGQSENQIHLTPTFNLLYMGRIAKKKRLDVALHAFALALEKSNLRMKFIVCGSGEVSYIAQLKELVEVLQIEAYVEFRGWVDFSDKQLAFSESDCFILTSEDENFAIAAAEALSYGVPCILSSNVALASLVSKYDAGVVFREFTPDNIAQAIIKISTADRDVSKRLSLLASFELDWDVVAKQWESAIQSLVRQ